MAREKEDFRDNLEMLQGVFDTPTITLNQACKYLRKDARTLKRDKTFPIKRSSKTGFYMVPVVGMARWMCA